MNRGIRLVTAGILATGTLAAIGAAPAHAAERPYVLTKGHIDLFEVTYSNATNGLRLQVKDDTNIYQPQVAYRQPEDVTVSVDPATSAVVVPGGLPPEFEFLGAPGDTIYMLPQSQDPNLPWPGWSTERLTSTLPAGTMLPDSADAVELNVQVEGPGDVHTYMNGPAGNVINHYIDTTDAAPDTIPVSRSAHVHTEWVFTETGSYTLTVTPSAETTTGQELTGTPAEYHIQVGAGEDPGELGLEVTPNKAGAQYLYGQGITLTAAPTEQTDLDHYHWFIKPAGGSGFQVTNRSSTAELKLPTSLSWNNAQVYASLYDDDHNVIASSEPLTLKVTALAPVTTLTASADKASYEVGQTAQLSSTQSPQTTEDHYHWYLKKRGEEFYTYITGSDAATASLPIAADMDGGQVLVRLFNDDHAVIAESAPLTLDVDRGDPGSIATTTRVALSKPRQQYGDRRPAQVGVLVQAGDDGVVAGVVTLRAGGLTVARGVELTDAGKAVVRLPRRLPPGSHRVSASFTPTDEALAGSTSSPVTLRVTPAPTTTRAKLAPRKVRPGQRGRLVITVDSQLTPTGPVVVREGSRTLARATLGKNGRVTVTLPRLRKGKHRLLVTYQGNARYATSRARPVLRVGR